jgi:hypothetical protein
MSALKLLRDGSTDEDGDRTSNRKRSLSGSQQGQQGHKRVSF